jgi:hypothetical protein
MQDQLEIVIEVISSFLKDRKERVCGMVPKQRDGRGSKDPDIC